MVLFLLIKNKGRKNMAFCKYSTDSINSSSTLVDNIFIEQYLPYSPEICVKAYLLGLHRCQSSDFDNSIENFAKTLGITIQDVKSCFLYWQEQGLVTVINVDPIEVRFLPVKEKSFDDKKFKKSKYASFIAQIQEIIQGRMITPTEYKEYFCLIESFNLEPEALVMIAKYCTNQKGSDVGYAYILTVAKNWAYSGVRTCKDVEDKLKEYELVVSNVGEIIKLLGSKKQVDFYDKQLYLTWTQKLGYSNDVIQYVASSFKRKGTIDKLNAKLEKYYELKLLSEQEIEDYEKNKESLLSTAKMITKQIGVYYENLENVIETYVVKWQNMGYQYEELKVIANCCFKNNIRTLDGMNDAVEKFYNQGLTNLDSINQYFADIISTDEKIKNVLKSAGLARSVTSWDRDFYRTWTFTWNFSDDIILYACSLSTGKSHPISYVNQILSSWFNNHVDTLEKAKQQKISSGFGTQKSKALDFEQRSYSSEQINALFDNLKEVKI